MLDNDNIVFSEQKREQQILDMPLAVEVLRDPQLTLYRESSTGGSMKFITKNATPGHIDFFFREAVDHTAGILQGE